MLPAPRHKRTPPALTPASKAATRVTVPGGMEGWVDLGDLTFDYPGGSQTRDRLIEKVRRCPNPNLT